MPVLSITILIPMIYSIGWEKPNQFGTFPQAPLLDINIIQLANSYPDIRNSVKSLEYQKREK